MRKDSRVIEVEMGCAVRPGPDPGLHGSCSKLASALVVVAGPDPAIHVLPPADCRGNGVAARGWPVKQWAIEEEFGIVSLVSPKAGKADPGSSV